MRGACGAVLCALLLHAATALAQQPPPFDPALPGSRRDAGELEIVAPPSLETAPPAGMRADLPRLFVRGFRVAGSDAVARERVIEALAPWTGRWLDDAALQSARAALAGLYRGNGYPAASVAIPDQDVAGGVVSLQVHEGRIERVELVGDAEPGVIAQRLQRLLGNPLRAGQIEGALRALQLEFGLQARRATLLDGSEPGARVLRLELAGARRSLLGVDLANDRSPLLGGLRNAFEWRTRDALGRGDRLRLQLERGEGLEAFDAGARVPLGTGGVALDARLARYDARIVEAPIDRADIDSRVDIASAGLRVPLAYSQRRALTAFGTLEARDSRSRRAGKLFNPSPGVEDGRTQVRAARLGLDWLQYLEHDTSSLRLVLSRGLDAGNATIHHDSRPDGEFWAASLRAEWLHVLPRGQLYARFDGQAAQDLLPLEKMAIGGTWSVRGYRSAQFVRDRAWDASLEYRLPLARMALPLAGGERGDNWLRGVLFVDAGQALADDAGERGDQELLAAGPGLRWRGGTGMEAQFYWAALRRDTVRRGRDDAQDRGIHFLLSLSYPL